MDKLIEILEDIKPGVDYETCDTLIDDGLLDSFAILSIVSELQDEFDIAILRQILFRRTLTLQRRFGKWSAV